jgi:hypothetical protein
VDLWRACFGAGSLDIVWEVDQSGPMDELVFVRGGGEAAASATLPYAAGLGPPPLPPVGAPAPSSGGTTASVSSPGLPTTGGQRAAAPGGAPAPETAPGGQLSLAGLNLPAGWSGATIVGLGLLFGLAGLLLAAVPARVTGATEARRCDWEER